MSKHITIEKVTGGFIIHIENDSVVETKLPAVLKFVKEHFTEVSAVESIQNSSLMSLVEAERKN